MAYRIYPSEFLSGGTSKVDSATTLADGVYTPDGFSFSGGSGKVTISCSKITVTNGQAYATIAFSSPYPFSLSVLSESFCHEDI